MMQHDETAPAPVVTFEGRYEIIAKLGQGGFGVVHKARQLSTGQPVALKVMRGADGGVTQTGRRVARFLREAHLCAQLRHPNIVPLVDSGQLADGTLYTAFTFVPGDNLATLLATEGALAPREARYLMLQVLDALACAHAGGVVHRDLKPSNIMVIPTGARRNALVLDFGIGAIVDDERATRLTGPDEVLGTPGYGAPEQWRGETPSPRADLFSWGLVFLECLTGTPVYAGAPAEIFYQLLGPDPVPMPPALQRHPLGDLLARAVRKDVDTRDVTARELLEALDACEPRGLSREALLGAPGDVWSRASRAATVHGSPQESAPPALDGERRPLTALRCRVSVSTAAVPPPDAEAMDDDVRSALASCAEIGGRHGGTVAAVLGDELLIYFGYPRAAEDDARRAARAALAITGAVDAENANTAARSVRLEVCIGIHSGAVVDGMLGDLEGARLVTGTTPRVAARLAALAPPGSVMVSAAAQALLRGSFELEPVAIEPLEGSAAPVAFQLGKEHRAAAGGTRADDTEASISGRDYELGLLLERWQRVCEGSGQSSLITGDPGIGKSRLVRAFRARIAHQAHRSLVARCTPDTQHSALAPVIELLEHALALAEESTTTGKIARLERELASHGFTPAEVMPLFLPLFSLPLEAPYRPLEASAPRQKALMLQAIVSLLFAMTSKEPVLLLTEDLHWADSITMELLTQLVREAPEAPMCVLMTARPELSSSFATAGVLALPLSRLQRPQIEEMLGALVRHKPLPPAAIQHVADRADGVPLFVEELLRMMIDTGLLVEREDRYELTGSLSDEAIPGTLRGVLAARLDRLSRAKETAQLAAALGREFSLEVLSAASPHGPAVVTDDLEKLLLAGIVQRKRRGKDAVGVFKHALVRDAAYESLSPSGRRRAHARIAGTLEERFPEVARSRPDLLAHHHAAAEQMGPAVGYAQQAAELGLQRSTYPEAIAHASHAVAWARALPAAEAVEAELIANGALIQGLMATRGWAHPEVKAAADRSASLVRQLEPDSKHRVPMLWFLFAYHHVASHRRMAREVANQLVEIGERSDDRGLRAATLTLYGLARFIDGAHADARLALERAVEIDDPALHRDHGARFGLDSLVLAKAYVGQLRWFSGDTDSAFAHTASAMARARELGHVPSLAIGLLYACLVYQMAGDRSMVAELAGEILALSEKYGLPAYEGYAATLHDWATGETQRAQAIAAGLADLGCALGLSHYASLVADSLAARGELDEAITCIDHCLSLCHQNDEHYYEPELHRRRALYEARRDPQAPSIRASLERAAELARRQDMPRIEAQATKELLRRFGRSEPYAARLDELLGTRPGLQAID